MTTPPKPPTPESTAPTVELPTFRSKWTKEGISNYAETLTPAISQILSDWEPSPSIALFESLFIASNNLLLSHATTSNRSLPIPPPPRKPPKSPELAQIRKNLRLAKTLVKSNPSNSTHQVKYLYMQARKLSRKRVLDMALKSNKVFNSLISSNPSKAFRAIGRIKSDKTKSIKLLTVGTPTKSSWS